MTLKLNEEALTTANSTHGEIDFHNWIGDSWAILFSHPKDFTLCAQRNSEVANMEQEFVEKL